MLCALCTKVLLERKWAVPTDIERPHHNFCDLQKAATAGCAICWELLKHLQTVPHGLEMAGSIPLQIAYQFWGWDDALYMKFHLGQEKSVQFELRPMENTEGEIMGVTSGEKADVKQAISRAKSDAKDKPWMVQDCRSIPGHPLSTGDPEVLSLAKAWLEVCQRDHKSCADTNAAFYPKRLLDLSNGQPYLVVTGGRTLRDPYATLSHCWGQDDFFTLTEDTLDDMMVGIPLEKLPKSFQDAILICKRLEINYLWIDSLCIIQSSKDVEKNWKERTETVADKDWKEHAITMAEIYRNCLLNISIDRASNPYQGAFAERPPGVLGICTALVGQRHHYRWQGWWRRHTWKNSSHRKWLNLFRKKKLVYFHLFGTSSDTLNCITDMPLSRRAWVFQERFMSPRVLHFGTDRIFWECRSLCRIEGPGGEDQRLEPSGWFFQGSDPENLRNNWKAMVSHYTGLSLTRPEKDKLVAFAAVAQEFEKRMDDEYMAGLFRSELPYALLWRMFPQAHNCTRSVDQGPSWSWACLNSDAPLRFKYLCKGAIAEVLEIDVKHVDERNRYGMVSSGTLRIKGRMGFCLWDERIQHHSLERGVFVTGIPATPHTGTIVDFEQPQVTGSFDTKNDRVSYRDRECDFLLITPYAGLILAETETKGVYKRIGMGQVWQFPTLEAYEEREIRLI
ncbi:hypothetical protein HDK77DRAFT_451204 [Phyllosticta capitalensis]